MLDVWLMNQQPKGPKGPGKGQGDYRGPKGSRDHPNPDQIPKVAGGGANADRNSSSNAGHGSYE